MLSDRLYQIWLLQLQTWAAEGTLLEATLRALRLKANKPPRRLTQLVDQIADGDSSVLPPIEVLPNRSMSGAAGAYGADTDTIYLNEKWLKKAKTQDFIKVLTEEFGHHLDTLYNTKDTDGDEGKKLSQLLTSQSIKGWNEREEAPEFSLNDHGKIWIGNKPLKVEFSRTNASTTTQFRKAVRFDGAAPTGYLVSAAGNDVLWSPLARHIHFGLRSNVASGKTASRGQPWASTIVFRRNTSPHSDEQYIWQAGRVSGSYDRLKLVITTDGKLSFEIGDWSGNNLTFESTITIPLNEWTGLYIDYNGGRTNDEDVGAQRFRIKTVSLADGSSQDLPGSWTANGDGATAIIGGNIYIGAGQSGGKGLSADMASLVFTTLKVDENLPDSEEIGNMTTDPALWVQNKVNTIYRMPTVNNSTSGKFIPQDLLNNGNTSKHYEASSATRVYLFGDRTWRSTQAERLQTSNGGINNQIYAGNNTTTDLLVGSGRSFNTGFLSDLAIPGIGPTISNITSTAADGSYGIGSTITISATYSSSVNVNTTSGTPTLELETGSTDRTAAYSSGTGTSNLSFTYTVQEGDNTNDLAYTSTSALSLNSGTIRSSSGYANNSSNTLITPGDSNSLSANKTLTIDGIRPTIAINSNVNSLKAGETASLSFTLSESSTTFDVNDLSVTGGSISNFSGSGTSYSATFTPTANSTDDGVMSVANNAFTDAASNTNNDGSDANNSVTLSVNTIRPTIAINSNVNSLKASETASLSFTLSESSTTFDANDLSISGGSISSFSGSGTSYSATFTPTAESTANGVISVASSRFSNAAGNLNNDGSDANNSVTLSVDTIRPTIAITENDDDDSLKAGESTTFTFTLSEASSDFTQSDVSVSGGALSNWNKASATSYSATFTPTAESSADGVISVASSRFSDAAGNLNNDGSDANNSVSLTVDTRSPAPSPSPAPAPSPAPSSSRTPSRTPTRTPNPANNQKPQPAKTPSPTPDPTPAQTKSPNPPLGSGPSASPDTTTPSTNTGRNHSTQPTLILSAHSLGTQHNNTTYTLKQPDKKCQAILNIDNQSTGNDKESSGEILSYSISKGNKKNLFSISSSGVLSFAPNSFSLKSKKQVFPLTISISSSKRSQPATTQVRIVIPGQSLPTNNCNQQSLRPRIRDHRVLGQSCDDTLRGNPSYTALHGLNGQDKLHGRRANDSLYGGRGNDSLFAGAGQDQLSGHKGHDLLNGQLGADRLNGNAGRDTLLGGSDNDTLRGGLGNDTLHGGPGADLLRGWRNNDTLRGGQGNDTLRGGQGRDFLHGGPGADLFRGWRNHDTLRGGRDNDTLRGGQGNDILHGGPGADLLRGWRNHDTLRAGQDNDTLRGGQGNDTLHGGPGADLFHLSSGRDTILDFHPQQGDRLHTRSAQTLRFMQRNNDLLLLDPSLNIHTSLLNTSLHDLLHAHPELNT